MSFAEIPTELLVLVFAHLSGWDLLKCQAVSRKWRDVIMHAMELQYMIDLVKYGYKSSVPLQDTLSFTPQIPIQDLHHLEEAWFRICDSPQERPRPPRINIPVSSQEWYRHYDFRLFGHNLFVWNQDSDGVLDIFQFEDQKNHVSFQRVDYDVGGILEYAYDPKQNLLIIVGTAVDNDERDVIVLHVLLVHWPNGCDANNIEPKLEMLHRFTLSTIDISLGHTSWIQMDVWISGEYVLVRWKNVMVGDLGTSATSQDSNIAVCLWRSGQVLQRYISNAETCYMDAVLACTQYLLVLRHSRSEANISAYGTRSVLCFDVYLLATNPSECLQQPLLISTFQFPPLRPEIAAQDPILTSGEWNSPSLKPLNTFLSSPRSQIALSPLDTMLYLDIWCGIEELDSQCTNEWFSLFVPFSTFIRDTTPLSVMSQTPSPKPTIYPWSSWGPDGARLGRTGSLHANGDDSTNFTPVYISGFRAIVKDGAGFMDFNPYHISKFSSGESLPTPGATVVNSPTHVDCQIFAEPVTSALPYVWIPLPADVNPARSGDRHEFLLPNFFFQDYDGLKMLHLCASPADPLRVGSIEIHTL